MAILCDVKNLCGGCDYTDISYKEELAIKENQIKDLFKLHINENLDEIGFENLISTGIEKEYRNKMEFSFGDTTKGGPLTLGLHQKNFFYNILSSKNCELIDDKIKEIIKTTEDFFNEKEISYYNKKNHTGYLRHLVVRKSFYESSYMINLVTTSNNVGMNEKNVGESKNVGEASCFPNANVGEASCFLYDYVSLITNLFSDKLKINILHTTNDNVADKVACDKIETLYGKDYIYEEVLGLKFKITPFSFFFFFTKGAEILYDKIREFAKSLNKELNIIYDLFCGTGTIAQILSPLAKKVYGVEIIKEAIDSAKENAKLNNLSNVFFKAEDINVLMKNNDFLNEKPDLIVLDPPRSGVMQKTLEKVLEFGACDIIYVSCKIESFIRDYAMFKSRGYKVKKVCPVDMFARTKHVETVVLLSKS